MSASGVHGWPLAGIAQTRTVAPAKGTPRELKTMSSLREPCARAGPIAPGTTCSASASIAQRNPIAIFDRIIILLPLGRSESEHLTRLALSVIGSTHGSYEPIDTNSS